MKNKAFLVFGLLFVLFITACSDKTILIDKTQTKTVNNTFFDGSRSFQLQDFASSCSFSVSSNVSNLTCSSGDASFLTVNNGVWTLSCCDFLGSKCYWYNTSDVVGFNESKQFADNVLGSKFESGTYGSMCCNSQMSQCFWQKPSLNGSFQSCGQEYDQILVSSQFNATGNGDWSVVTCLDGFK